MDQKQLNEANMGQWEEDGFYEIIFQLPLTARHGLAVGKWEKDSEWGVDLRRWSYHEQRILKSGLSLDMETWEALYHLIQDLNKNGLFKDYGDIDEEEYQYQIDIDDSFSLETEIFDPGNSRRKPYFCINLVDMDGERVPLAWRVFAGIIISFENINEFLNKASFYKLVKIEIEGNKEGEIDPRTGKRIL